METMLRALPPGPPQGRLQSLPATPPASLCVRMEKRLPLLRVPGSLGIPNGANPLLCRRAFLCSEPGGGEPEQPVEPSSAIVPEQPVEPPSPIVPAEPRPEDHLSVIVLPLPFRPLFPGFHMPIFVKDPELLQALVENCRSSEPFAGAFLIKDEPGTDGSESEMCIHDLKGKELFKHLHEVGTLAQITSIQGEQVMLLGHHRLRITGMVGEDPLTVKVDHLKDLPYDEDDDIMKATSFEVISTLREVLKTSSLWRDHVLAYTQLISDFNYSKLADFGAAMSGANKLLCQQVLEELDVLKRLKLTLELVKKEVEINKLQESISKAIEEKLSGEQRRFLLNEQLKAIKKELGVETDDKTALSAKFRQRLERNRERCPPHVLQVIEEDLTKLRLLEASSNEFNITRNYLDWLTSLPWGNYSAENFDVHHAQKILDEDHYGLCEVKERILEFIAVGKLRGTSQGKIICLSGPPGVGKTSIGRSIARALNRKFYRFSVGGLGDVSEIKGHRRTYVGAMPGKMVQCLKSVGTANPLVLIDEIDKLGKGHAGDPAGALLELLDPEQNANFLDHYLDVSIDLSKVEVTDGALLSLIENYCREAGVRNLQKHIEKIYRKIALKLVRQGLPNEHSPDYTVHHQCPKKDLVEVSIQESSEDVGYTITEAECTNAVSHEQANEVEWKEVDVENFDENVDKPLIKHNPSKTDVALNQAETDKPANSSENAADKEVPPVEKVFQKVVVDESNLADFVGKPVFHSERIYDQTPIGVVMGLAWTAMGGSTLYVETAQVEQGKGSLHLTGQLGDVMKESAHIAHTVARAILLEKEPGNTFFTSTKLHLHVPAGATTKDGPSAGCTMITSMLSLAMRKLVKKDLTMTGEVTLTGRILPIGGIKEKTIAARRSDVKTIIFPSANRRDFDELAANVKEGLDVHFVDNYSQIFDLAFGR